MLLAIAGAYGMTGSVIVTFIAAVIALLVTCGRGRAGTLKQ